LPFRLRSAIASITTVPNPHRFGGDTGSPLLSVHLIVKVSPSAPQEISRRPVLTESAPYFPALVASSCSASQDLNAYSERWVRSIKEECLSKVLLIRERSLRLALSEYVRITIRSVIIRGKLAAVRQNHQQQQRYGIQYVLEEQRAAHGLDVPPRELAHALSEFLEAPPGHHRNGSNCTSDSGRSFKVHSRSNSCTCTSRAPVLVSISIAHRSAS
jgi:hypothetical protein